jgi:hypothetical protein
MLDFALNFTKVSLPVAIVFATAWVWISKGSSEAWNYFVIMVLFWVGVLVMYDLLRKYRIF